jgi:hypothetical protein
MPALGTPPLESDTGPASRRPQQVELKLYIARSTPNSVRAEQNLQAALKNVWTDNVVFSIEVIDVFANAKRAIRDNVIVTPTLIIAHGGKDQTIVGDLSNTTRLHAMLIPQ